MFLSIPGKFTGNRNCLYSEDVAHTFLHQLLLTSLRKKQRGAGKTFRMNVSAEVHDNKNCCDKISTLPTKSNLVKTTVDILTALKAESVPARNSN